MTMRTHLWLHGGLALAVLGVVGLGAVGVAVPSFLVYAVVLACPAMMLLMVRGMADRDGREPPAGRGSEPVSEPDPRGAPSTP